MSVVPCGQEVRYEKNDKLYNLRIGRGFGGKGVTLVIVLGVARVGLSRSCCEDGVQDDRGSVMVLPSIIGQGKYYQTVLNKWSPVKTSVVDLGLEVPMGGYEWSLWEVRRGPDEWLRKVPMGG